MFRKGLEPPTKASKKQLARAAADLLNGNQFLDKGGDSPHSFFCIPYAFSVIQGTALLSSLNEKEKIELLCDFNGNRVSRNKVARRIYTLLLEEGSPLNKIFKESQLLQANPRFMMSYQAKNLLDDFSEIVDSELLTHS